MQFALKSNFTAILIWSPIGVGNKTPCHSYGLTTFLLLNMYIIDLEFNPRFAIIRKKKCSKEKTHQNIWVLTPSSFNILLFCALPSVIDQSYFTFELVYQLQNVSIVIWKSLRVIYNEKKKMTIPPDIFPPKYSKLIQNVVTKSVFSFYQYLRLYGKKMHFFVSENSILNEK